MLVACNEEVTTPRPDLRYEIGLMDGDSSHQICLAFGCSAPSDAERIDLLYGAYQALLNALWSGDQDCIDMFQKGYNKVYNRDVYWADSIVVPDEFGVRQHYAGWAVFWRPGGSTQPREEREIYIHKNISQEPTLRISTLGHEAFHHLRGEAYTEANTLAVQ